MEPTKPIRQLCDWPGCLHPVQRACPLLGGALLCDIHIAYVSFADSPGALALSEQGKAVIRVAEARNAIAPE